MSLLMLRILRYVLATLLINNRMLSEIHDNLHKRLTDPIDPYHNNHRNEGYGIMMELDELIITTEKKKG